MTVMSPTDERAIRDVARAIFTDRSPLRQQHESVATGVALPRELFTELGRLGFFSPSSPTATGGLGPASVTAGVLAEEAGRELVPGPLIEQLVAARMAAGTSALADEIAAADVVTAIGFGSRSGLRFAPGKGAVTGEVASIGFGEDADRWLLPVPAPDGGGWNVAVVDRATSRMSVRPGESSIDPLWRSCGARLDDTPVVGVLQATGEEMEAHVAYASVLSAAYGIGASRRVLEDTVAYARNRQQFGRPIGSFQAVKHHAANAHIDVLHAESLTRAALDERAATHDRHLAKLAADRCYRSVAEIALQIHGGMGFTAESTVHLFLKNAQRLRTWPVPVSEHWAAVRRALGLDPQEQRGVG